MNFYKKLAIFSISFLIFSSIPFILKYFSNQYYNNQKGNYININNIDENTKTQIEQNISSKYIYLFTTDKKIYQPYEKIMFTLNIVEKETKTILSNIRPKLTLKNEQGKKLQNIFDQDNFIMTFNTNNNSFTYELYMKDVHYLGTVTAELEFDDITILELQKQNLEFTIQKKSSKYPMPNNYTFLGFDSKELLSFRKILSTKGEETTFSGISAWLKMLNTDAVMIPVAITKSYDKGTQPWATDKLVESEKIAERFNKAKIDVALWIQALQIEGVDSDKYEYILAEYTGKDFAQDTVISLSDNQRKDQLKKITSEFMNDNRVSFLGFSKVFFNNTYTELQNEFKQHFSLNNINKQAFELWKEYQAVEYFKHILSSVPSKKPVFFMFNEVELAENPRFLDMAFAAGVDFVFVDINSQILDMNTHFNMMNKYKGLDKYKDKLIFSYCLNYNNLVTGTSPVINNWINQSLGLYNKFNSSSIRIKDFYRAMFGNRGSYPAYEWMLAIGDLLTQWKEQKEIMPLTQNIVANTSIVSNNIELIIELQNTSLSTITDISVSLLPLVSSVDFDSLLVKELKSGDFFRTNIVLTDIEFKQMLLQKQARYIAFNTLFSQGKQYSMVRLISFIDPDVEVDQKLVLDNDFHDRMQSLRKKERIAEEKLKKQKEQELSNQLLQQQKIKEAIDKKEEKEAIDKKEEKEAIEKKEEKKKPKRRWGIRRKSKDEDEEDEE